MSIMQSRDQATLDRVHAVYCPFCGAHAGEWCQTVYRGNLTYPHKRRRRFALVRELERSRRSA